MNERHIPNRADREIAHGAMLAQADPENIWGWKTPAGQLRAKRRAELIGNGANLKPGIRVLEVGCGTGMFTEMFARTGANLVAVDISGELLQRARLRRLPPDRVTLLEGAFEDCDLAGPFDALIGSSVLHHLDMEKALSKAWGLLKPGGCMSFAEPNMLNPQIFIERKFTLLRPWLSYVSADETAFVRWKLARALARHGFEDIRIVPFDWLHPLIPRPLIHCIQSIGRALEHIPGVCEFAGSLHIRCRRPLAARAG